MIGITDVISVFDKPSHLCEVRFKIGATKAVRNLCKNGDLRVHSGVTSQEVRPFVKFFKGKCNVYYSTFLHILINRHFTM